MGRDPIWVCELEFWAREINWLHKSDLEIFVNFTRKLEVGLQ